MSTNSNTIDIALISSQHRVGHENWNISFTLSNQILRNLYPFLQALKGYLKRFEVGFEGNIDAKSIEKYISVDKNKIPQYYFSRSQILYRLRQLYKVGILINRNRSKFNRDLWRMEPRKYFGIDYTLLDTCYTKAEKIFADYYKRLKPLTLKKEKNTTCFVKARKDTFFGNYIYLQKKYNFELSQNAINDNNYNNQQKEIIQNIKNNTDLKVPKAKYPQKAHDTIGVKWKCTSLYFDKPFERESYSIKGFYQWSLKIGLIKHLPYKSYDYFKKLIQTKGSGMFFNVIEYQIVK